MDEHTESRVLQLVARILQVDPDTITTNSSPTTVPGWDSLNHMKLILALEEEFDVMLDEEQIVRMVSFGAIVDALDGAGS